MAKRRRDFEFHPEAMIEAREAADWYAVQSPQAAKEFKRELRKAESLVNHSPQMWSSYLHGTRILKLDRLPYGLVYLERDDRVIIIAVAHLIVALVTGNRDCRPELLAFSSLHNSLTPRQESR